MSDETPDAVPEAPEAPAETPAATEGGDQVSPTPVEGSGEFDIASLPAEAQAYIKELREESRDRRKAYDPYKNAFAAYNDSEKEYLLNMVGTLAADQEQGGKMMLDLAQRMLGIEEAAEEAVSSEAVEEAKQAGMSEDEYRRIVKEEMESAQLVAEIHAETASLGIDVQSEEAEELWDLAYRLEIDDLSEAYRILQARKGATPEAAPVEEEAVAEEPEAVFPVTAGADTGANGTNAEDRMPPPKIGSEEMRDRVRRRIEASARPG